MIQWFPWWLAGLVGAASAVSVEYLNRAGLGFGPTILRTLPLMITTQLALYVAFSRAPRWLAIWALFSLGTSSLRLLGIWMTGSEVQSWARAVLGVSMMLAAQYVIRGALK